MSSKVVTEKIGDGIELMIEGLPSSVMTPATQANAALALIQHGIPMAGAFSAGVIGGISSAALKINGQIYQLKYSIVAQRAITALEIFSEAIDWIEFKRAKGQVDDILADSTINFLRQYLKDEHTKILKKHKG